MADIDPRTTGEGWERRVLEKVALSAIAEQRASRRWGVLFKSLILIYLFAVLFIGMGWIKRGDYKSPGKHTALVELRGVIAADSLASADNITSGLQAAFKDRQVEIEVKRTAPLSFILRLKGETSITETLCTALEALIEEKARAA